MSSTIGPISSGSGNDATSTPATSTPATSSPATSSPATSSPATDTSVVDTSSNTKDTSSNSDPTTTQSDPTSSADTTTTPTSTSQTTTSSTKASTTSSTSSPSSSSRTTTSRKSTSSSDTDTSDSVLTQTSSINDVTKHLTSTAAGGPTTTSISDSSSSGSSSTGKTVGIVFGALVGTVIIGYLAYYIYRRCSKKEEDRPLSELVLAADPHPPSTQDDDYYGGALDEKASTRVSESETVDPTIVPRPNSAYYRADGYGSASYNEGAYDARQANFNPTYHTAFQTAENSYDIATYPAYNNNVQHHQDVDNLTIAQSIYGRPAYYNDINNAQYHY